MDETIITWNFTNWITVIIMGVTGIAAVMFVIQLLRRARGSQATEG